MSDYQKSKFEVIPHSYGFEVKLVTVTFTGVIFRKIATVGTLAIAELIATDLNRYTIGVDL